MKKTLMLFIAILCTFLSCNDKYPDLEDGLYAEFKTDKGTMVTQLYYQDAPATVANFIALAEGNHPLVDSAYANKPFYNGLKFHRIIKNFMIQGGDPLGTGAGNPGYKFHDEFSPERRHDTIGVLSMANSGFATNGSQFFITHKATPHLDGYDAQGNLKNCENKAVRNRRQRVSCHTVWGQLVIGFDVLDSIAGVQMNNPSAGKPKKDVLIQEVTIIRKGSKAKKFDAPATFTNELAKLEERKAAEEAERLKTFSSVKERFDAKRPKAEKLPSGLSIFWDKKGNGLKPNVGATFQAHYSGFFTTGELFDTSIADVAESQGQLDEKRKAAGGYAPMERKYSMDEALITGFKEGIMQMSVGDKATIFIPSHLGYGEQGHPAGIPPNTDLVFELELVGVK